MLASPGEGPGVLPDSPFYFMKTIGRGITYAFTFDSDAKAALTLDYANEDVRAMHVTCSRAQYVETVELCNEYKTDFFNALVWAVKAAKEGGDTRALVDSIVAAHHDHRLVLASLLQLTEEIPTEAVIDAVAYTAAPLRYVIQEYEGTAAAVSFDAAVRTDFSSIDPGLWATIEARLLPETETDSAEDAAQAGSASGAASTSGPSHEDAPPTETVPPVVGFDSATGRYGMYSLGLVYTTEGVLSGGCYGEYIVLINNGAAQNPTYKELLAFLKADDTDKYVYSYTFPVAGFYYGDAEDSIDVAYLTDIVEGRAFPSDPRICADFAERLHNNAELAGIRAGYVSIDLEGYPDAEGYGIPSDAGHALNVFETSDRGLVFIDCTGGSEGGPKHMDSEVGSLELGATYRPRLLFVSEDWHLLSMGKITAVETTWDGEWRP